MARIFAYIEHQRWRGRRFRIGTRGRGEKDRCHCFAYGHCDRLGRGS